MTGEFTNENARIRVWPNGRPGMFTVEIEDRETRAVAAGQFHVSELAEWVCELMLVVESVGCVLVPGYTPHKG